MAFSLQTSQMSRIFQTLGADPNKLGFFFIFPPLIGMIIQPLLGKFSDGFWSPRFGRRMPLLMFSAPMAAIIMVLLPNAGSFGFGYASMGALVFGSIAIILMDLSNNACMQPFRMIIGDMVNENQKDKAWSWQQSFSNLGGVLANICPFVLTWIGVANVDKKKGLCHYQLGYHFTLPLLFYYLFRLTQFFLLKSMILKPMHNIIILIIKRKKRKNHIGH